MKQPDHVEAVVDVLAKWGVRSRHGEWSDRETQLSCARDVLKALNVDDRLAQAWHEGHLDGVEMQHLIETGEDPWPDHLAKNPYGEPSSLTGKYVPPDPEP